MAAREPTGQRGDFESRRSWAPVEGTMRAQLRYLWERLPAQVQLRRCRLDWLRVRVPQQARVASRRSVGNWPVGCCSYSRASERR